MSHLRSKQRGAALVVALILLVVATLIGLAASRDTVLQERMSANSYDRSLAFQRSEAALRAAEGRIVLTPNVTTLGGLDCSASACALVPANSFTGTDALWQNVTTEFNVNTVRTPGTPQYHIAYMGEGPAETQDDAINVGNLNIGGPRPVQILAFFRITARSSDPSAGVLGGRSLVVLQTTMRRPR
jgi:type IV pilus assembly protein PilX